MTKKQICVLKTEGGRARTIRCCIDHIAVTLQTQDESDESKTTRFTEPLTFVFLRIMRSVLLFRIKNCRCNSMAISPLKILIIFEIWSLGSGFFTYKQKEKWEPN